MAANLGAADAGMREIERLADSGWRLLPCAHRSKAALLKGWPTLASSDLATIRKWAAKYTGCNWAVATGKDSGVFVLDIDGEKGRASLITLEERQGPLPDTLTSRTGRVDGGEHRWFKYPAGREIRGNAGRLGVGLDVKATKGYVVVPPSIHETGQPYQWAEPQRSVADAPASLVEMLTDKTGNPRIPLSECFGILTEGKRNDGLASYGGALRRKGAELAELEEKLLIYNSRHCQPPLEEDEVCEIAESMVRYPIGGPDPLELAWQAVQSEVPPTRTAQFVELCRHLQSARAEQSIALPIQRIGELMGVHWTTVSNFRKDAVKRGWLKPVEQYIAHRRAGHYRLIESQIPTDTKTLTKPLTLTNGLVRISSLGFPSEDQEKAPSEKCPHVSCAGLAGSADGPLPSMPRCPHCASFALYRQNNVGTYECLTCELVGIEESIARGIAGIPAL
ncbi:bifunctional DNA primase/polymerase [Telmatobacter sp. DSM 110680]|uniref:Bifunctional DNA primase/polymerase n=1 Tax=Telmatobacter sp. DSM 110680 TaxID=3036704 RepID=A0AAU7DNS9_9BACT